MKKILSVILALVMMLTIMPMNVFAAEPTSGACGDNLTWTFDESTGELIVDGTGAMYNNGYNNPPWKSYEDEIKTITIGDSVTTIGDNAFACCYNLASVTLGNSVTTIGAYAFGECGSLTSIAIPDSVKIIEHEAFACCNNLASVTISDSVTEIGGNVFGSTAYYNNSSNWENDVLYIGNHLIDVKNTISGEYIVKEGTQTIACEAFYACDNITSIIIPDSVTRIDRYVFHDCISLTSVTIPDTVTTIGEGAFYFCESLTTVTIPDSVTSIGAYAFFSCNNLISVTIPDSITFIDRHTFSYCDNLEELKILGNAHLILSDEALLGSPKVMLCCKENSWIHSYADSQGLKICLYDENGIPSFEIKNDVLISYRGNSNDVFVSSAMKIGYGAFENNNDIKRVELSTAINRIYDSAFKNCSSLETIIIPQNVAFIGDDSFEGCNNLTIYGYAGSYAETYAKKHGIDFEYITLTVSAETYEMNIFDTLQLETDYNIFLNEEDEIVWSCDDNGVVSVSSKGKVTALSSGEAVVTATSSKGLSATCIIKVGESATEEKGKVHSVTISDVSLDYKASTTITPLITVDSGVKYTVTYSSSNPSVASVDANGKVSTGKTGSATITVTVTDEFGNTVSDTCEVKVNYNWWQWIIVIVLFGWIWY